MAGKSPGEVPYAGGSRLPAYMTNGKNDGVTRVLLLRAKPTNDDASDQPSLPSNPFLIARSIEAVIGYNNRLSVTATREARGARYVLRTQSPLAYKELLKMSHLTDERKTEVEVLDHPTLNFVQGVVFDHDTVDLSEADLVEELKSEGVTAVRRITKKLRTGVIKNTPLMILTFRGTQRPEHIMFGMLRVNVRPYYPSVLLCRNCAAYGHSGKHCTSPAVCLTCSQNHPIDEKQDCPNPPFCCHCDGAHSPVSRDCPVFRKEEAVIRLRIDRGISFQEARSEVEQSEQKTTYASKVQERLHESSDKDKEISLLRDELKKIRDQMKDYFAIKQELDSLKKQVKTSTNDTATQETAEPTSPTSNEILKTRLSRMDSGKGSSQMFKLGGAANIQPQFPKPPRNEQERSTSRKRVLLTPPTPKEKLRKRNTNPNYKEIDTPLGGDSDYDDVFHR